jgi:hypothetical protein
LSQFRNRCFDARRCPAIDDYRGAFIRQRLRDGKADPGRRSGDEGAFPFQL